MIAKLKRGEAVTLKDGTTIKPSQVCAPNTPGTVC